MKKITLLQSAFALIAAFMLALPARAQVASAADLFGTYKFTADVNVTDAGQALKDNFKSECEVIITKCSYNIFDGEIQGLAGATAAQSINAVDVAANTIKITNPNGNGLWGGGLYMSNSEGVYPFGGNYNDILYTFDPATKTITLPDFTLVTCDHANSAATIAASFTNAKLTLVQSENIDVTDLSGDWHYTAGKGTYDTMEGSTLPTEWDMTLTATDDSKKAYNISLTLGDFAPLALTATFDGVTLTIPFNEDYFDAEQKIGLVNMYGVARPGTITFNMANENLLTLTSGMTIAQDSISPEVPGGYKQWYLNGSAKRQGGETEKVTWEGTYKIKAGSIYKAIADYEYPEEFDMVVTYNADYDIYMVTEFFGNDVSALNYGGISFKPSADDPNKAEIVTSTGYLKTIVAGESYLTLKDLNLSSASNIVITRLEDGTYTLSDFSISYMTYDADWKQQHALAAFYQTVTAEKEPETAPFTWASTFTVKVGSVDVYKEIEGYEYPKEFEMEVTYNADYDIYMVTKFLGNDVATLNYGGISFKVSADDPNNAEIATTTGYLKTLVAGESYLTLKDMNLSTSPVTLTHNGDGTVTISDFCVSYMTYDANYNQLHEVAALYSGVSATSGYATVGIEDTEVAPALKAWSANGTIYVAGEAQTVEVYDMSGRTVFSGVASQVSGLNKGLYLVKVKNAVAKVAVK